MYSRLLQIRLEALTADFIYTKKINDLANITKIINFFTIIFPVLILAVTSLAKGTCYEGLFNIISFLIGAIFLCLTIWSFVAGYESQKERYILGRRENKFIASESLKFLEAKTQDSELSWFFNYVNERDSIDSENIGIYNEVLRQQAYRESLKRLIPGSSEITCAFCKASPFKFEKGGCELCGNTPQEDE